MLSVLIPGQRSCRACAVHTDANTGACASQLVHQRLSLRGPLVLASNFLTHEWGKQIGTNLFHNGLNPARVTCYEANSFTLCSFFTARISRADIEVPNEAID